MDFDRREDTGLSTTWAGFASTGAGVLATISWGCCGFAGPLAWLSALVFTALALGLGWLAMQRLPPRSDGYVFALVGVMLGVGNAIPLLLGLLLQVSVVLFAFSIWLLGSM